MRRSRYGIAPEPADQGHLEPQQRHRDGDGTRLDANEHHQADAEQHDEHRRRHREVRTEPRQLVPRGVDNVLRSAGEVLARPVGAELGVEVRAPPPPRSTPRVRRRSRRPRPRSRSRAARDARASKAETSRPANTANVTNSAVELNGAVATPATASQTSDLRLAVRSAHAPSPSSASAQNASHVYCLRSLRMSETGASITTSATTVAAKRALDRRRQPSVRVNT